MRAPPSLAALHRRYDGPIDGRLRDAALAGRPCAAGAMLAAASRDLDRLALSTVLARARARQRAVAAARTGAHLAGDAADAASTVALSWYRGLGVRTIDACAAARRERPCDKGLPKDRGR